MVKMKTEIYFFVIIFFILRVFETQKLFSLDRNPLFNYKLEKQNL